MHYEVNLFDKSSWHPEPQILALLLQRLLPSGHYPKMEQVILCCDGIVQDVQSETQGVVTMG